MSVLKPEISVILCVYNSEKYIALAIESVLSQTFRNFELIIINDGSTDHSQSIINTFEDDRIRMFKKQNTGLIDSLNFGIFHSRSNWIARIDADDIALPNRFEEQYKLISDDVAVIGSQAYLIKEDGIKYGITKFSTSHKDIVYNLENLFSNIIHPSVLINKNLLEKVGGYDSKMHVAEDFDLWLRISKVGKIININKPLIKLRKHENNISVTKLDIALDNCQISLAYHFRSNSFAVMSKEDFNSLRKNVKIWNKSFKNNNIEWVKIKDNINKSKGFRKITYLIFRSNLIVTYIKIKLEKKRLLDKIKYFSN